jgi:murein DD-endopeptidase MepM/ murein hydrolase activator NlpD
VNGISAEIQSDQKSPETWERIRQEQVAVDAARAQLLPITAFRQTFRWPAIGPVSGVFGSQRVYNGEPGRPHYGVDVAVPTGTRVYAPADGIVTLARKDMYYSGGTIILDHGFGLSSSFLHLSKVLVKVGDVIKQGDVLAETGATGRASGPHLDWRMNWLDRRVDAQLLVPAMPDQPVQKSKSNK